MVAFASSLLLTAILLGIVVLVGRKRAVDAPLTWGEAMAAGTFVFFIMFWAYGMVPHLWLTWADNELQWRPDNLFYGPFDIVKPQAFGGWFPMTINYQVIRDIVATLLYVVFLGGNIAMWVWWNNRGKRAEAAKQLPTSGYGRPLVRKGAV